MIAWRRRLPWLPGEPLGSGWRSPGAPSPKAPRYLSPVATRTSWTLSRPITEEHFDAAFAVNVRGIVFGVQKAMPLFSSGASVVLIGSSTSQRPDPGLEVYGASKAALRHFARSWARTTRKHGFRVNVLSPGPIKTPGLHGTVPEDQQEELVRQFSEAVPVGRIGEADEVTEVALLLASDATTYLNGAEWFIDGGYAQI